MNNKIIIPVGFPIGIITNEEENVGIIDLGKETVTLDIKSFIIWQKLFQLVNSNMIFENSKDTYGLEEINSIINELLKEKIAIELIDSPEIQNDFDKIENLRIFRQGHGFGQIKEEKEKYIVFNESEIDLDILQFTIWSAGNMGLTIKEIYTEFCNGIQKNIFILSLLRLLHMNLIYLMR